MRPSVRLLQHTARITLFTRQQCSLCDNAKAVLTKLGKKRSFDYHEIDVMRPGQEQWKLAYEFDAPVVSTPDLKTRKRYLSIHHKVHVQRVFHTYSKPDIATEARKLMHRFTEEQVQALIDEAEGHS